MPNIIAIFLTGLLTGGLSCLAVQGGLLATTLVDKSEKNKVVPLISFLFAKLIAYTILGFLLGWLGSFFQLSLTAKIIMQFAVAIFMFGAAMNLLNVHPIFRYFAIQPPRFLTRKLRGQSSPVILGAFTIFIPCGTTQAMMALAIGTTNPILGALVMFAFVLGTTPVFFTLGYLATRIGEKMEKNFYKFAAIIILSLSILTFSGALSLSGFSLRDVYCTITFCSNNESTPTSEESTIIFNSNGYSPNIITLKANKESVIHLNNKDGAGCIQAFTIPKLNIEKIVTIGSVSDVTIPPQAPGTNINFMCSMGMYQGTIKFL